ncbi:hypothetical protein [Methanolobus sp. ZRKC5]|uniref:hypothetical protein n=1 Tax=unclassified Methanolobus TaxID=2629569 RepID=UPI00313EF794
MKELEFETWLLNELKERRFHELIDNFDEIKNLAKAYEKDSFISNLHGSFNQLLVQNWSQGILLMEQLKLVDNQIDIIKGKGKPSQIDILFRIEEKGLFSIVELKRPLSQKSKNKSTIREAVSEILGYANGLSTVFPGLPSKSHLLIIVSSEWPQIISNAISLLSSFHGFSIIEVNAEYKSPDEIRLTIRNPTDLYLSKKGGISADIVECFSFEFSDENIKLQLLLDMIKQQLQGSDLNGFLILSQPLKKSNVDNFILSFCIINPYLLLHSTLDESAISLVKQSLGLPFECSIDDVKLELNNIAREWNSGIESTLLESFSLLKLFGIEITPSFKKSNLGYFVSYGHNEELIFHIDFIGFMTDYFVLWFKNEKNRTLIQKFCSNLEGWAYYEQIQRNPLTKLFAISELFQISEFRREIITAHDVFLHGRKWGRITNIALMGSSEEYDSEFPFFFIGFARSPFKIPITMGKKGIAENGEKFVESMCELLSDRGNPVYGYLLLIGYLLESKLYIPESLSINTFVLTNLEERITNLIRLVEESGYDDFSNELSNLIKHIDFSNYCIGLSDDVKNSIATFETFLINDNSIDSIGWQYLAGPTVWTSDFKKISNYSAYHN